MASPAITCRTATPTATTVISVPASRIRETGAARTAVQRRAFSPETKLARRVAAYNPVGMVSKPKSAAAKPLAESRPASPAVEASSAKRGFSSKNSRIEAISTPKITKYAAMPASHPTEGRMARRAANPPTEDSSKVRGGRLAATETRPPPTSRCRAATSAATANNVA